MPDAKHRHVRRFAWADLIAAGICVVTVVIFWAMDRISWAVIAGAAGLLLAVVGVVLVRMSRTPRPGPGRTKGQTPPGETPEEAQAPVVPLERQPVAPADQAEGFGWMKASDLANQKNKP